MKILFFSLLIFLNIFCLVKCCLNHIYCYICPYNSTDPNYESSLLISLNQDINLNASQCVLKNYSFILTRNIVIRNSINCPECLLRSYDSVYDSLPEAFQSESQFSSNFLNSNLNFFLQSGSHYVFQKDFFTDGVQLFRRILANIRIQNLSPGFVSIYLKTNRFYLFVSKNLIIENIDFFGNDINFNENEPCMISNNTICCSESALNSELNFSSQNKGCGLKGSISFDNDQSIDYGLINLEYIFDNPNILEKPKLILNNCSFQNFYLLTNLNGFGSVVMLNYFSGSIEINNLNLLNVYFVQSFIFYSHSDYDLNIILQNNLITDEKFLNNIANLKIMITITNSKIRNFNLLQIKNAKTSYIDNFATLLNYNGDLFFENSTFDLQFENSFIFKIISLDPNVGNYYFKNSNFSRIYNSSLIFVENANYLFFELIYFSECSNLKSELLELANVNLIDFKNSYLINILASSIISLIKITKSNTKISDSFFINNLANSIFLQTSNNLTLINCTFDNISFSDAIIIFKKGNILNSINLVFKNIIGTMAIFYSSESNQVILDTANLKKVRCYSIFFLSNALQNIAKNFYLSQSQITLIWSSLQTCFVITLNKAYITLNVFALFFNNFIGNSYAFNLKSVYINDNNFTNSAMIRVISGLMTFDNLFLINNFFLNTKLFQMILNFAKATLSAITNCYFENNGVIEKKTYYVGLTENCFFSIGLGLKYSIYDNIIMVASNKIEMVSGFFSGDSFGNLFQLTNSRLIILSANPSFGYKGIYMTDFLNAYVSNNTFYNLLCNTKSKAHMHGSVAFLGTSASYSYSKNTKSIYFINNTFYNCNCIYGGSLAIIGLKFVTIENCFFYNSSATKAGGHLVLIAGEQFLLKNIYMNHSSALKEGGGMFLQNIYNVSIENLTIFNALSEKNGAIFCRFIINFSLKNLLSQNTSALNGGFLYFMKGTANLTNLYVSSSIADYFGGAIYTDGFSNLYLKNGSFEKCGADNGGTFNIENSEKIIINQCKIISCSANLKGGAFLIKSIYLLNIIDIIFENNVVSNGIGIFLIENDDESASIEIKNVKCLNNLAMKGSCIYYISSTPLNLQTIQINDCKDIPILITWFFPININISELIISDINADSNLFFLMESHINFDNFTFKNNNLSKHLMEFNTITGLLKNIRFENNSNSKAFNFYQSDILISMFSLVNDENFFNKLGFFSSISSNLNFNDGNIDNSYDFSNNIANFTGGNLILKNTTFTNSRGQILVLSISNLFLSHCFFMNNSNNGNLKGNDINFINPQSKLFQIVILNTNFYVMSESSLEFDGLLNISLINSELNNINSNTTSKIFAMAALNIYQLLIRNCSFSSFSDSSLKIYSDKFSFASEMQVYIYATIFRKNKALVGSCVYIDAAGNIQFKENIFSDNIAYITDVGLKNLEGIAPAVFFKSLSGISSNISFFSCQFVNNIAEYLAPTVFSQTNIKIDNSNSFSNNKESFGNFNDKMFSFPINLKLVSYQDFEKKINFTDDLTINFVSGEKFNLTFQLVDNFDQVLFFDNLTIIIIKSYVEQDQDQSDIFVETALATCRKGEFEFKNLLIRTVVRDIFSLSFEGDLAKLTKDEKNQLISVKIKKTLHFKSRECEKGEIVLNDSSCFKCRENKYSLLDPAKTQTKYQRCYQCPQNAYCKGGSNITPHAGFYRKNENSTDVVACINPLACFGYVENASGDSLIHGECKTGNYGPLCYYCKVSYGKYQNNDYCNYCNLMMALIYVRMFLSVLFIVLNLIINVANIEKDANKNDIFNIVFKIIINHGQQIILIIRNSLSLPDFSIFVSLFDVSDFLSFIDIGSFMNQCVIHNYYYNPKQLSFFLSLFSAFIPFIIAIAALLIWLLLGLILVLGLKSTYFKNQLGFDNFPNKIFTKFLLFILLSVYMFYPMILKSSFSLMDCLYIDKNDSISYLRESPEIQCWDSEHYKYIALFSLPGLIIWGIFFPILLFFLLQKTYQKYQTITNSPDKKNKQISVVNKKKKLLKNHKNINSLKNSTVLTFFFCGYQSQFYYWESLIFLRKFSLTFVLTLDQTLEQEFKWIIVISVLTIYINITWLKSPYKLKFCNRLEMFSLVTCLISVLVAVLNEANETSIFVQIFNILCITANLVFYLAALFYILYHFLKKIKSKILMIKSKLSDKFKSIFKNKNSKIENVPRFLEKSEKIHIKEGKKLEIKNSIVLQNINE